MIQTDENQMIFITDENNITLFNEEEEKEEKKIYSQKISDYDILIIDYLEFDLQNSSLIKELIINKAKIDLTYEEVCFLREFIKEKVDEYSGKKRFRLYELMAGLYNNITLKEYGKVD